MAQKIRYYRADGDVYNDSYNDLWDSRSYAATPEQISKSYFVAALNDAYKSANCFDIGSLAFASMQYWVCGDEEFIFIYHENEGLNITVVCVTGDSLEALQRDLMRVVMS